MGDKQVITHSIVILVINTLPRLLICLMDSDHVALYLGLRYHNMVTRIATVYMTTFAFDPVMTNGVNMWRGFSSTSLPKESRTILKNMQYIEQLWTVDVPAVTEYSPFSPFNRLFANKDESPSQTTTLCHCSTTSSIPGSAHP